jgi:hypothetical protein
MRDLKGFHERSRTIKANREDRKRRRGVSLRQRRKSKVSGACWNWFGSTPIWKRNKSSSSRTDVSQAVLQSHQLKQKAKKAKCVRMNEWDEQRANLVQGDRINQINKEEAGNLLANFVVLDRMQFKCLRTRYVNNLLLVFDFKSTRIERFFERRFDERIYRSFQIKISINKLTTTNQNWRMVSEIDQCW